MSLDKTHNSAEQKFQAGERLNSFDKADLKRRILSDSNYSVTQSCLYIFGREFPPDEDIIQRARHFILIERFPGLTATSLKVLIDFWGLRDNLLLEMEKYLDFNLYEDWYDEVIVSASFLFRNSTLQSADAAQKLLKLRKEARSHNEDYLLDLIS